MPRLRVAGVTPRPAAQPVDLDAAPPLPAGFDPDISTGYTVTLTQFVGMRPVAHVLCLALVAGNGAPCGWRQELADVPLDDAAQLVPRAIALWIRHCDADRAHRAAGL